MQVGRHYAGFWRRLAAWLIDTVLFAMLAGLLHRLFFPATGMMVSVDAGGAFMLHNQHNWFDSLLIFIVTVVMWVKLMGTPGKLLLGCHVVDARSGKPVSLGQAVLRYVSYLVSLIPFGLGFFWIAWDKHKQGFHDKIAKTVVLVENIRWQDAEADKSLDQIVKELR